VESFATTAVIVVVALSCNVAGGELWKETEIPEVTETEGLELDPHPLRVTILATHASRTIFSLIAFALFGHNRCR
jgi:hypothetical protein